METHLPTPLFRAMCVTSGEYVHRIYVVQWAEFVLEMCPTIGLEIRMGLYTSGEESLATQWDTNGPPLAGLWERSFKQIALGTYLVD